MGGARELLCANTCVQSQSHKCVKIFNVRKIAEKLSPTVCIYQAIFIVSQMCVCVCVRVCVLICVCECVCVCLLVIA